jgi:adenylate cyclase class 2
MSKEIEVRIQIDESFLVGVKKWLDENAEYKGNIHHIEYYLNKPATTFLFTAPEGYKDANDFFRVRFTENGDSMCLKKFHKDPIEKRPLYCDEYEIGVSDGKQALELMRALGYTEQTLVDKSRDTYVVDCFEIVLDRVKNVGIFMEVELKKEVENARVGLEEIYQFLKLMGITKFKLQKRGYVSMLWNPNYNFGVEVEL